MGNTFKCRPNDFIQKVVSTRNSLAHNGTYKEHLTHIELLLYGKVIEFVIKLEILKLFGTNAEYIQEIKDDSKMHIEILAKLNEYKK
jgi:hypothetical protein